MNINTYGDNKYSIDTPNQKDPGLNTTDVETKVKTNDETVVYSLGVYLRRLVLPQFINGLRNRSISPLDGESLCNEMHGRGINVRYLGMIGTKLYSQDELAKQNGKEGLCVQTPFVTKVIIEIEMITRCCRHYVSSLLRSSDIIQCAPGPFIAKFLSVLLGCGTVDTADEASDPGKQTKRRVIKEPD